MVANKVAGLQQTKSVAFVTQKKTLHLRQRFWSGRRLLSGIHCLSAVIASNLTSSFSLVGLIFLLSITSGILDFVKKKELASKKKAALKKKEVVAARKKGRTKH